MIGLRGVLLILAILLFVIAVFSDVHQGDLIAWGLAATAAGRANVLDRTQSRVAGPLGLGHKERQNGR